MPIERNGAGPDKGRPAPDRQAGIDGEITDEDRCGRMGRAQTGQPPPSPHEGGDDRMTMTRWGAADIGHQAANPLNAAATRGSD
jgi:hypothetical protein